MFFGLLLSDDLIVQGQPLQGMKAPVDAYAQGPFFQGMIQGYLALDGPAGLAYAILVIQAIKQFGVKEKKAVVKYTCLCGLGAAVCLSIVYFALAYIGAMTPGAYANGGVLLSEVARSLFGEAGVLLLGIAVLLACLTTSIGLVTSFGDYLISVNPRFSYKKVAMIVCAFSFVIANIGLSEMIAISLPILVMLYPISIVLMVCSLFHKQIRSRRMVYVLSMIFAFAISFFSGLDQAGLHLGAVHDLAATVPFYTYGLGWMLPAIIGALLGSLPIWKHWNASA